MTENQNFGQAIEALKQGKKVARNGWNGKGMYLTLIQGYPVNGHLQCHIHESVPFMPHGAGKEHGLCPDGSPNIMKHHAGNMLDHIVMKTAGDSKYWGVGYNDYVPWLASQTDILSEDWCILD